MSDNSKRFSSLRKQTRRPQLPSASSSHTGSLVSPLPVLPSIQQRVKDIRQKHLYLCQKIVSFKIGTSEVDYFPAEEDEGVGGASVAVPKYLNLLHMEIQRGIVALNQDMVSIVHDNESLNVITDKEIRQLYVLIRDLERDFLFCKKKKKSARKSAKIRIKTAREIDEASLDIPEIIPFNSQDDKSSSVSRISFPSIESEKDDASEKTLSPDTCQNSLPFIQTQVNNLISVKPKMAPPPLKFMRQKSNMGYPFASCFPELPPAPKNRMPNVSSIPKHSCFRENSFFKVPKPARVHRVGRDKTFLY